MVAASVLRPYCLLPLTRKSNHVCTSTLVFMSDLFLIPSCHFLAASAWMGVLGWTCGVVVVDDEWPVKYHPMDIRPSIMPMARGLFPPCRKPRRRDKTAKTTDLFSPAVIPVTPRLAIVEGQNYGIRAHTLVCGVKRASGFFVYYCLKYISTL